MSHAPLDTNSDGATNATQTFAKLPVATFESLVLFSGRPCSASEQMGSAQPQSMQRLLAVLPLPGCH